MRPSHAIRAGLRSLVALTLVACGTGGPRVESSVDGVVRSRHGDTTIVVTTRDGVWGPLHDAVEVLRVGGKTRATTFGSAHMLAATPDGGVVLVDSKNLDGLIIIRQFNANGEFVRNLGRQGSGPGEYSQAGQIVVAAQDNGTIVVRDGGRAVNRYSAAGEFIGGFPLGQRNASTFELIAVTDGSIYTRGAFPRGGGMGTALPAMLRYDTAGTVLDSIVEVGDWLPDSRPMGGRFTPQQAWSLLPDKRIVYSRSDKVGFLVIDRSRKQKPLIVEREAAPVPFLPEERAELEAVQEMMQRNAAQVPGMKVDAVPQNKLPMRGLVIDIDGRVWIYKSNTAQKVAARLGGIANNQRVNVTYAEPEILAGFNTDGTFLGEVRFPIGARPAFVGDFAWVMLNDEEDGPVLVKYRLK